MIAAALLPTVSLIASFVVIAVAGLFTVRSNVAQTWRDNFEAEKAARLAAEAEAKEQRELKHQALNELAATRMKTDLTPLLEYAAQLRADLERERGEDMARIEAKIQQAAASIVDALQRQDE